MNKELYSHLEEIFEKIFSSLAPMLSKDSKDGVLHFVNHGELEMAVEGFCLELIEQSLDLSEPLQSSLVELCVSLNLDKESVFAFDFWERFQRYLTRK